MIRVSLLMGYETQKRTYDGDLELRVSVQYRPAQDEEDEEEVVIHFGRANDPGIDKPHLLALTLSPEIAEQMAKAIMGIDEMKARSVTFEFDD